MPPRWSRSAQLSFFLRETAPSPRPVERRAATLPRKSSGAGATKPKTKVAYVPASHGAAASPPSATPRRALLSPRVQLRDLGEFPLIARIERMARRVTGRDVVLGIGDDAALLRVRRGEVLAVTTDAFVEDVHFRFRDESALAIGRRALVANLSDLAAMGARPIGVHVRARGAAAARRARRARPRARDARRGEALRRAARRRQPDARARGLAHDRRVRRRAARPARCAATARARATASSSPGRSAAPRSTALRAERAAGRGGAPSPAPRLAAGRALAASAGVGACIDVSDGLAADLGHVLAASRVGGELHVDARSRPPGFAAACAAPDRDPRALASAGGEDYELLFTRRRAGARRRAARAPAGRPGSPRSAASRARPAPRSARPSGRPIDGAWTHF